MISVAIIVVVFLLVFFLHFPHVVKEQNKGFLCFYLISFTLSMVVLSINSMGIPLQGPSHWIMALIQRIGLVPV